MLEKKEKEKEEESSEEKDDKDKEKNGTASEIEIPRRMRRNLELSRAKELNDGKPLDWKSTRDSAHEKHQVRTSDPIFFSDRTV
ncbi:hypothetical protein Y032_0115g480 [Ancylostoma ceylanicum]|nr:hypothetical protein Y032_0115g480 [Ancylostoma ceylanicum]